jgi:hypothetical protein
LHAWYESVLSACLILLGDKHAGGIKLSWVQIAALLAALAGFIIALVRLAQALSLWLLYVLCGCCFYLHAWHETVLGDKHAGGIRPSWFHRGTGGAGRVHHCPGE